MKNPVVHPFLFGAFPVVFLFSHNSDIASPAAMLRPLCVITILTALLLVLLWSILKDLGKAGIAASIFLLLFFSYGRMLSIAESLLPFGDGALRVGLAALMGCLFVLAAAYVSGKGRAMASLTRLLNIFAFALVIVPASSALYSAAMRPSPDGGYVRTAEASTARSRPDIYFIVLDGYARQDVMDNIYGYDNSDFIGYLRGRGFFVADKGAANYAQTYLSLSCSLNFDYHDAPSGVDGCSSDDRSLLVDKIKNSKAVSLLRARGYTVAAFSTGYEGTELKEADIYISPWWHLSEFENVLSVTTPLAPFLARSQYDLHREKVLNIFDKLPELSGDGKPLFVFAHILAPHPPFVFGADGEGLTPDRPFTLSDGSHLIGDEAPSGYKLSYQAQSRFVSKKTMQMLGRLMSRPGPKPVVLLMSDHGPGSRLSWGDAASTDFRERMSILSAVYLPGIDKGLLYDGITPVNTFRLVFDEYLGTKKGLLEDRSYFSTWDKPYDFIDVTEAVRMSPTGGREKDR